MPDPATPISATVANGAAAPPEAPPPAPPHVTAPADDLAGAQAGPAGLRDPYPPPWVTAVRAVVPLVVGLVLSWAMYAVVVPTAGGFGVLILLTGISVIAAVSLNIVNGYAGQFSIGHAGFMAVGGYTAAAIVYYG